MRCQGGAQTTLALFNIGNSKAALSKRHGGRAEAGSGEP